jgi:hypothetical protein
MHNKSQSYKALSAIYTRDSVVHKRTVTGDSDLKLKTTGQRTFKNVNNCLNANIYPYLETSGGKSYNPYLNFVHFFNTTNMV